MTFPVLLLCVIPFAPYRSYFAPLFTSTSFRFYSSWSLRTFARWSKHFRFIQDIFLNALWTQKIVKAKRNVRPMNLFSTSGVLPTSLVLLILPHVTAYPQQQPQQPLYSIASFDSSSDFALETACNAIYRRSIQSCQPFDFVSTNPCSTTCVQSLQSIQLEAQSACASQGGIPQSSLLASFRNGTGVTQLCASTKNGNVATTLATQVGNGASPTIPPGAGGVSTATSVPADQSKATSMDLGNTGVVAIIIIVCVGSVLLLLVAVFYYNKHYNKKSPP